MNNITIGLDIAKNVFHAVIMNRAGKVIKKKRLKRPSVADFFANQEVCVVVLESCGSSNYWARYIQKFGHEVKLIAPQHVVPYRRKGKNDYNDAEAIAEASQRESMVFVPIKTIAQQDIQMLLRIRERCLQQSTKLGNQIRGLLAEYGLTINLGKAAIKRQLPEILEDGENELTDFSRALFHELYEDYIALQERISAYEKQIQQAIKNNPVCERAQTVVGIGPITAAAIYAAVGRGQQFVNGRHFSAWCGLVPRQYSTGGKNVLLGITKRGNSYLRCLLIHGARSALKYASKKEDSLSKWATKLMHEKGYNKACVALANKLGRIVWAVITKEQPYLAA